MPVFPNTQLPNLHPGTWTPTSPATGRYNCIAYAASDHWWWPLIPGYWPHGVPRLLDIQTFNQAFQTIGYRVCSGPDLVIGTEKVAIFAVGAEPKHAARQLNSGLWTSKLGPFIDIQHQLNAICGPEYGIPVSFLERPVETINSLPSSHPQQSTP